MSSALHRIRLSRETRLLLVTISISAAVLLLLSRMRFPESAPIMESPPAPLERLVARATYTELAGIIASVERRISQNLVVLQLAPQADTRPRVLSDVLGSAPADEAIRHIPALRISETIVVAAVGPETRIVGLVGRFEGTAPAELITTDPVRRLSLVRVPPIAPETLPQITLSDLRSPAYVVVVEGTRAGLTFRPLFVGTDDRFVDPRWDRPMLALSSVALTGPGALMFSLEGQFLGSAIVQDGELAIAGARDVLAVADRLLRTEATSPADAGIAVQPLTPALAAALGVNAGVVVAQVRTDGPAYGVLEPIDVITHIEGRPASSPDALLLHIAQRPPGADIDMDIVRRGEPLHASITLPGQEAGNSNTTGGMHLQMQSSGSVVTGVVPETPADRAGLRAGDVIVHAGETAAPSPAELNSLLRGLEPSKYLVLRVDRGGQQRVLAIAGLARAQ